MPRHTSRSAFSAKLGIVPALDIDSLAHMTRVVRATTRVEGIVGYKLGLTTVLRLGLAGAVRRLRKETDLPIIYDHQKAGPDMPDMAGKFVALCKEAGVDGLILFPIAGPTAVREFAGRAIKAGLVPVVGGEIPVPDYGIAGGGFVADDGLERIIRHAASTGVRHYVLPANDPKRIRSRTRWIVKHVKRPTVFLTGFGPLGGVIGKAFAAASDCPRRLAVIGRNITASPDPAESARRLVDEIMAAA